MKSLCHFQSRIRYNFKDINVLKSALCHSSIKKKYYLYNSEVLEFLGDRVLGLAICDCLMIEFPLLDEGDISFLFNYLISRDTCKSVAISLKLNEYLLLPKSVDVFVGSSLSNFCEALVGAIYMDGGLNQVKVFLKDFWNIPQKVNSRLKTGIKDPKTLFYEWSAKTKAKFCFQVSKTGPVHRPSFFIKLKVDGFPFVSGFGLSKYKAEKNAIEKFIQKVNIRENEYSIKGRC